MRYMGNKQKLLGEIDKMLEKHGAKQEGYVFCDAFSGTGTVSDHYNGFFQIIANDMLTLSYEFTAGLITLGDDPWQKLGFDPFEYFANQDTASYESGFCYNNFSPNGGCQYFSDENAKTIDFIRDTIDEWYDAEKITTAERSYLIACLLESVSKVANVAGVYSAFLKIWDPRAVKPLIYAPLPTKHTEYENVVYCDDILNLVDEIEGDILYLDPPYTPTQYNSQYHTLETIARNDNPETHGKGKHRDNDRLSLWCKKGFVEAEFARLIKDAKFKHIVFSYSDKGIMSPKFISAVMKRYGKPETFEFKKITFSKYKSTRAVNREKADGTENKVHYEYLFYVEKRDEEEPARYISPLNYIGGKWDALSFLGANMPEKVDGTFYDLFGGGGTVALNAPADKVVYNEINPFVVELLEYLATTPPTDIYKQIGRLTKKYGLEKGNKEAYVALREAYNADQNPLMLYLLICYGFEHQIRFNNDHKFNNPCGNSGFNEEMYEKLISFYLRCQDLDITFRCGSYLEVEDEIKPGDFVYLDPPYLGNTGAYQDGKRGFNGWDAEQEEEMHRFMERLDERGVKFMLSNYTEHTSGNDNPLSEWAEANGFRVIVDEKITKRNRTNRRELVVVNPINV